MKKVTEEELNKAKELKQELDISYMELGSVALQKNETIRQITELSNDLNTWNKKEEESTNKTINIKKQVDEFIIMMETKYGSGILNLETGEII